MGDERPRMIGGVLVYTAKDIHDDVASGMDPDCLFVSHEKHDALRAQLDTEVAENVRLRTREVGDETANVLQELADANNRIAELETERRKVQEALYAFSPELMESEARDVLKLAHTLTAERATLTAALTNTRAESLRVVSDGDPVPVSALGAGDLLRCDYPGIWQKRGDPAAGLTYIVRLDTEMQGTALTHAASVQPVRLENWEADE